MKARSDAENHKNCNLSRKMELIAICRGKCQISRFVAVDAKYRDSAPTATNFCPCFIWRISNFPLFLRQNEDTEICHETLIKKCAFQVHRHLQFSDYLLYSDVKSIKMYINPRLLDQSH